VDQDSDDSDSEIFRVKRRSSLKVDKRDVNDAMHAKQSDHQVCFVNVLISVAFIWCLNILGTVTPDFYQLYLCCVFLHCSGLFTIIVFHQHRVA
jgi:hypothetical protein